MTTRTASASLTKQPARPAGVADASVSATYTHGDVLRVLLSS